MSLRINTNVSSISAQRWVGRTDRRLSDNLRKLASGERITRGADDAAGLSISENLKAQIRGNGRAKRNANDAISLIQTAEGGLSEISSIIIRLRELAVQASSDTLGNTERGFGNIEFQQLKEEVERIAHGSEFNKIKLLNGQSGLLEFQVGVHNDPFLDRLRYDGTGANATLKALGLAGGGVGTKRGAQTALKKLDDALVKVNGIRAHLGAVQNRLMSAIQNLANSGENLSAANSRIRDVDMAEETAALAKNSILMEAGTGVLGQANQTLQAALKLLG